MWIKEQHMLEMSKKENICSRVPMIGFRQEKL